MSLDIYLTAMQPVSVHSQNFTHNITEMADAVGIYMCLWRQEEAGIVKAEQLIKPLESGLSKLKAAPDRYRKYDAPNGWGTYDDFVPWVEELLTACKKYPNAKIDTSV